MRRLLSAALLCLTFAAPAFAHNAAVTAAYAKPTLKGTTNGILFFTITSPHDDAITAVSTPAAATAELHEHTMRGDIMQMRKVEKVELKGGEPVAFVPGGYHVMLFGVKKPLSVGDTLALTIVFEKSPSITVTVPVLAEAPEHTAAPMDMGEHSHH